MTIGAPRVDLAALIELERLLIRPANPAHSQSDVAIVREEGNEVSQIAGGDAEPADEPAIRQRPAGRGGSPPSGTRSFRSLAQILMQAAGLSVEELEDDQR